MEPGCDGCGNSWIAVTPEQEAKMPLPDTQTKEYAIETLKNLSRDGFGTSDKPFFVAVGFHKVCESAVCRGFYVLSACTFSAASSFQLARQVLRFVPTIRD